MRFPLFVATVGSLAALCANQSQAQSTDPAVLAKFTQDQRAELEKLLAEARKANLPTEPIVQRIEAARSKGLADGEVVKAATEVKARLGTSARALGDAGRRAVDPQEVTLGAAILERGATYAQLESVIRTAQPTRSLVVPFDVLVKLTDSGRPVGTALAQVSGKLVARASDGEITSLLSKSS